MHEDADASAPRGPGYRLRNAREARGMTVAEVARELRLDQRVVEALEDDGFASLPAPIFVRGYINAYCKLLRIPADECLAEYERAVGAAEPPPLVIRRAAGDEISADGGSPVVLVSWLVAVVAVVMVVLWWYSHPADDSAPAVRSQPAAPIGTPAVAEQEPDRVEPLPDALPQPVVRSEPVPAPLALRIEFTAESWAEVTDADGRRLYFDLARPGEVVEVDGRAPIAVFLGNAPAARIAVDGRPFDHTRWIRSGNVARFSIGAAGPGNPR